MHENSDEYDDSNIEHDGVQQELWICKRCHHESTTKSNLLSHLRRKFPCKVTGENVTTKAYIEDLLKLPVQEEKRYSCSYCNYQFNTRQSKSRHMKTCKVLHGTTKIIIEDTEDDIENTEASTSHQVPNEEENQGYIHQITALTTELQQKNMTIENMKLEIAFLKNKKNEQFYQEIMERQFNKTLNIGITDITTDDAHYEIKRWSCWKEALSQLQLYNDEDPKEHLYACFFETCTDNHKEKVQKCLNKYNIECLEFHQDESGINLYNLQDKTIVFTYKV